LKKGKPLAQTAAITRRVFMEKIALSTELVNAILQYLGSQKFVEVAQLINGIQQEAQAQAAPAAPTDVTVIE
jgi:hypothetical protein